MRSLEKITAAPEYEAFGWLTNEELGQHGLAPTRPLFENVNELFQGRKCAATLSDGLIAYRELELPNGNATESRSMIESEIALECERECEELCIESWGLPSSRKNSQTTLVGAVSLDKSLAIGIANDLNRSGFECLALDAPQCAIARATAMVVEDEQAATLAVELGYRQTTLTLVTAGEPLMSRCLTGLGLSRMLEDVAISFGISMGDAQTLLFADIQRHQDSTGNGVQASVMQMARAFAQSLAMEINRTVSFVHRSNSRLAPRQLILMGEGVQLCGIESSLRERIAIPIDLWAIPHPTHRLSRQQIATYAIASGLSALAWEEK